MTRFLLLALFLCLVPVAARPQTDAPPTHGSNAYVTDSLAPASDPGRESVPKGKPKAAEQDDHEETAMFPHLIADRIWISGQANFILQAHGPFHSPYQGTNSLIGQGETAGSRVLSLYTGVRLPHSTEVIFDLEETGGGGLSQALGLAGFTNLDVVRNPALGQGIYMSRVMVHQTIHLSSERTEVEPTPLSLARSVPSRRLEFRAGKMGMVDFFDTNAVGSDSHLQFTNWAIDNNGAYDYAADTRGYTYAAILEYQSRRFGVRFGEALMPKVANGIDLEWNLTVARGENLEIEFRPEWRKGWATTIRPIAYLNHANMGSYVEAINAWKAGATPLPDVTRSRHQGTLKQGFGLNIEQELPAHLRAFLRTGWNEGRHESFAYTEINNTIAIGMDLTGDSWNRKYDRIGSAIVSNGLSKDHREYLADGGLGFLLGDGRLNYGREFISESYYNVHVWRGLYAAAQLSIIANPGYNRDRGPAVIPGLRGHIDF
ncbi:MAG TPA: carbohydrate porin [Acidisarcina sp.]|nr:carbohydrate porin [Acidisarcina sp.]